MVQMLLLLTLFLPFADTAAGESGDKSREVLQSQLQSVDSEIQAVEEEEANVVKEINDRKGNRIFYNTIQLRQLDQDLVTLNQRLSDIRVKKGALYEQRTYLKGKLETTEKRDGDASR